MEYLTEKNISEITTLIKAKGVEMEELLYDLVDHVCCMIEEKMEQGKNYANALDEAMNSFGNKGIRNIQEETTYLLTKNILVMRKTMHIIGITSAVLLLLGSIFKIQHWPGAAIMYVLGVAFLCLIFMPLYLTVRAKEKVSKLNTVTNVIGVISAMALCFGILFKIMHWPMANMLMNIGGFILILIFLPLYIYSSYKSKNLKTTTIVPIIISVAGFSLMFSLVKLRNSSAVNNAIINIQYTINNDIEQTANSNDALWQSIPDTIKNNELKELNTIVIEINELSGSLIFNTAKSQHPQYNEQQLKHIMSSDYLQISGANTSFDVLRNDDGLEKLIQLVNVYQNQYKTLMGTTANIYMNQKNMDFYLTSDYSTFPLGLIIRDISYLNMQVQKTHTALLLNFKGRVS